MKAVFKGVLLAESDHTVVIEGNHYFPPDSVNRDYLQDSDRTSTCPWKGKSSYYTISAGGENAANAAWYYPQPKDAAAEIKDYVAFYTNKVTVE
jgi:uncharacterized protein (DUF427 family)